MRIRSGLMILGFVLAASGMSHGQGAGGFVGAWRQVISDSSPARKVRIPKELVIKLDGDTLGVIMKGPGKVHIINVSFPIGGPEVTYTGLDGDEFHLRVSRDGDRLVFDGSEHEDGRDLPVHETWTLRNKGDGQVLVDSKKCQVCRWGG